MSLIFETLKKLQDQPIKGKAYQRPPSKRQKAATKGRLFFSPWFIAGTTLGIIVAGFIAIYVLGAFQKQSKMKPVSRAVQSTPQVAKPIKIKQTGAEPAFIKAGSEPKATTEANFRPAGPESPSVKPSQANTAVESDRVLSKSDQLGMTSDEGAKLSRGPPTAPKMNHIKTASRPRRQTKSSAQDLIERTVKTGKSEPKNDLSSQARHIQTKIDRQARITRLVARIYAQMDRGEKEHVQKLMDELAGLKGHQHGYVLKLKAYWHLSNDEYSLAIAVLEEVLARDKGDLEAGINMAIAEMKTHQYKAAHERLTDLRKAYPDNSLIPELMQKIR